MWTDANNSIKDSEQLPGLNQRPRRQTFCLDPQYIRSAQQGQPRGTCPNTPRRQVFHSLIQITIDANTPNTDFIEAKRLARVQTCIDGMRVLRRHPIDNSVSDPHSAKSSHLPGKGNSVLICVGEMYSSFAVFPAASVVQLPAIS